MEGKVGWVSHSLGSSGQTGWKFSLRSQVGLVIWAL